MAAGVLYPTFGVLLSPVVAAAARCHRHLRVGASGDLYHELLPSVIGQRITRREPRMWGSSIVGFGAYRQRYANGAEREWLLTGFSPRKQALTLYIMSGFDDYTSLLAGLGTYRTGRSCLYVRNLEQVDTKALERLIRRSVAHLRRKWPTR